MVYFKENYIFKVPEGVQHFTGEGFQIFPGGGGGGGARMRMIDPLAFTVKPIPKDRFSHAMAYFSLLERLVTL